MVGMFPADGVKTADDVGELPVVGMVADGMLGIPTEGPPVLPVGCFSLLPVDCFPLLPNMDIDIDLTTVKTPRSNRILRMNSPDSPATMSL